MNHIQSFFDLGSLFNVHPPSAFSIAPIYYVVYVLLLVAWIAAPFVLRYLYPQKAHSLLRRSVQKMTSYLAASALPGIFLVWCRTQYIAIFSMRIWLLTLVLVQIGMVAYFIYEATVMYPKYRELLTAQLEKEKYLPKRKSRK